MKYALLLYGAERDWDEADDEEHAKVFAEHEEFGRLLDSRDAGRGGEALSPTRTATTVRRSGDDVVLTDGPYAETAEQLGGFYLIEARDLDEAIELAKACPEPIVEVRPVLEWAGE